MDRMIRDEEFTLILELDKVSSVRNVLTEPFFEDIEGDIRPREYCFASRVDPVRIWNFCCCMS